MSSLALYDTAVAMTGGNGIGRERADTRQLAEQLAASLLGDVQNLWDFYLSFSHEQNPGAEERVRAQFEQWARDADAAIERIKQVRREQGEVARYEELYHAHGKVMAMLSVSLEDVREGRAQIRRGEGIPLEEVKRELRLRRESQGAGDPRNP